MSVIRAMREESETIKFDNLFTNDLEQEQEFDLIFGAEQDDEDLKTIAGNAIIKEDGNEIVTNIPDCIAVNEDGEVVDKDDEAESSDSKEEPVEDLSDSDKDDDGVDDDVEAVASNQPDPSVVVNVDADNVNINAADPGVDAKGVAEADGEAEAEHNNVGMTINADTVNMTVGANAPTDAAPAVTAEPATAPVEVQDTETIDIEDKDGNNVPDDVDDAIEDAEAETQTPEEPAAAEDDNADATPNIDDNGEPTATAEAGIEDIYTASQLEDILNTGLEPAPAPQNTTPENEPVDPSTEVVFSDTGDQEVQEAAEPSKDDPVDFLTEEDGIIDIEDAEPIDGGDIKQNTDISPIGPDKVIPDEVNAPDEDIDYDKAAQEKREEKVEEAAEPSKDDPVDFITEADGVIGEEAADIPAVKNDENIENAADIEKDFNDDEKQVVDADVEKIMNDAPEDETKEEEGIEPVKPEDVPMNDGTAHESVDFLTEEDGIIDDITIGIAPTDDSEGIIQVEEPKHTDTSANSAIAGTNTDEVEDAVDTVEDLELPAHEADEPSKDDPVNFITEADGVIDEASEPMDPKEETTEQDAEDSLITMDPSLTGGDLISIYVDKPDDPDKKNDGKLAEAAEPSKDDPVELLGESDGIIYDLDEEAADIPAVKNDENLDNAADIEADFNDDEKQVTDANVEKIMNDAPEDETKEEEGIDPVKPEDVPMNDGTAHEAAEPSKDDPVDFLTEADGVIKLDESDIEEQINAEDNGDSFTDVMNNGLSTTPEEVDPTSEDAVADELIDDEILDLIESE